MSRTERKGQSELLLLTIDTTWPAASHSCHWALLAMMEKYPKLVSPNKPFLKMFSCFVFQVFLSQQ